MFDYHFYIYIIIYVHIIFIWYVVWDVGVSILLHYYYYAIAAAPSYHSSQIRGVFILSLATQQSKLLLYYPHKYHIVMRRA